MDIQRLVESRGAAGILAIGNQKDRLLLKLALLYLLQPLK